MTQAPFVSASTFWGMLTQDQKEEVLKNVRKEAAQRFQKYRDTVHTAVGLRTPKGAKRLEEYRARPSQQWEMLEMQFPDKYKEQRADWQRLERIEAQKPKTEPKVDPLLVSAPGGEPFSLKELK